MKRKKSHIAWEKEVVKRMIRLYCRKKEKNETFCPSCEELLHYAHKRLDRCPFGEQKGACKKCPIHCYQPAMRQKMKEIMRYSGPRMLLYAPWMAIQHLIYK